jgi:Domain of unknown function (DUF5615)
VKLVLDEHFSSRIAEQLRAGGFDVIAVTEPTDLRQLSDEALLEWAGHLGRVVVTENVDDFIPLFTARMSRGKLAAGLVLTSPRRFPRHRDAIGPLVGAISAFLQAHADLEQIAEGIVWL